MFEKIQTDAVDKGKKQHFQLREIWVRLFVRLTKKF